MKRSLQVILTVLLIAATAGCQSTTEESDTPAPRPETIRITSFGDADAEVRASVPFAKTGDLYVLEAGCDCVLSITPAGEISVAISKQQILDVTGRIRVSMTQAGIAFDAAGTLYFTEGETDSILKMKRGGSLETLISGEEIAQVVGQVDPDIEGLSVDSTGGVYINDNASDSTLRVDAVTGAATIFAAGADIGPLVGLDTVDLSSALTVGRGGVVYIANDTAPHAIIGSGPPHGAGVLAASRLFEGFQGFMTVAKNGDLIAMDSDAEVVFRITTVGDVSTFLSEPQLQSPIDGEDGKYLGGIAFDSDGNFYVAEANENHILKFDANLQGSIWVKASSIQVATRSLPDLIGGIAFAPTRVD